MVRETSTRAITPGTCPHVPERVARTRTAATIYPIKPVTLFYIFKISIRKIISRSLRPLYTQLLLSKDEQMIKKKEVLYYWFF